MQTSRKKRTYGVTIVEMVVVVAIMGAVALVARPSISKLLANQRLKDGAMSLVAGVNYARSEAILTGNVHLVFFETDALGATLLDGASNPVPMLILDDGRPGSANQNCRIDGGEPTRVVRLDDGITPGVTGVSTQSPNDLGSGTFSGGSSFTDPSSADASWVMFRPQGDPVSFDSTCDLGELGSGAGAFYVTNGARTAAVVLMPTGGTRLHSWDQGWTN
ncbi:MAG: pilus assembly FimT family protein [Ilumatobacteraceae bacterium]